MFKTAGWQSNCVATLCMSKADTVALAPLGRAQAALLGLTRGCPLAGPDVRMYLPLPQNEPIMRGACQHFKDRVETSLHFQNRLCLPADKCLYFC